MELSVLKRICGGARTHDLPVKSQTLYQLSYLADTCGVGKGHVIGVRSRGRCSLKTRLLGEKLIT